jgi:hypothetical protein
VRGKEAVLFKAQCALGAFNAVMERIILPWKLKRQDPHYKSLRFVKVNVLLHSDELADVNSPLVSDAAKAKLIVEGMRRNVLAQQPLVEPA